ncbi:MAG: ComEC/Rec2 family competence protein [Candidatus Cryptobacteroides sp.]
MVEGKEFGGFVLSFSAGTAVAAYSGVSCIHVISMLASVSLTSTAILASALLYMVCSRKTGPAGATVMMVGFCCGLACGFTADILSLSDISGNGTFPGGHFGGWMKETIGSIDFRDRDINALIKALVTGDRSDIPKEMTRTFRDSGASHILALSGLHLGIIYGLVTRILSFAGNSRTAIVLRSVLTTSFCGFYALATGASPSITRAFLFIAMAEAARLTYRSRSLGTILTGSLFIHLAISPSSVSSIGFQLSYAAMAGIAWIYPPLRRLWPDDGTRRFSPLKRIWETAAMSVSCQMTAGAVAWAYFGTFPKYFLITNLVALPISSLLIPSALVSMILSGMGICPDIICKMTGWLAGLLVESLETICLL